MCISTIKMCILVFPISIIVQFEKLLPKMTKWQLWYLFFFFFFLTVRVWEKQTWLKHGKSFKQGALINEQQQIHFQIKLRNSFHHGKSFSKAEVCGNHSQTHWGDIVWMPSALQSSSVKVIQSVLNKSFCSETQKWKQ